MVRHVLLAILMAFLALPAMAASDCAQPAKAVAHVQHQADSHSSHRQQDAPANEQGQRHDCIGCIAPLAKQAYRPVKSFFHALALIQPLTNVDGSLRPIGAPEPPPPRLLA